MKLISFSTSTLSERVGVVVNGVSYDLVECAKALGKVTPNIMGDFLRAGDAAMNTAREVVRAIEKGQPLTALQNGQFTLMAPVPHPTSCRDGYAFRQHVATARRNRGLEMIPEFDEYPVFYFTNHNAIVGPGPCEVESDHLRQLDFELEAAIVIGKEGRNICAKQTEEYIAGFTIMNDFSARVLQMEEMKLSLGPAKGKDFATALGPWLVTVDELAPFAIETPHGAKHRLRMRAFHNGSPVSDGNLADMNWTFAEIIERASYGVTLYPGDVIGSGTVGTGCFLELNGSAALEAKSAGRAHTPVWLMPGDTITLDIEGLGQLTNTFVKAPREISILAKKKSSFVAVA